SATHGARMVAAGDRRFSRGPNAWRETNSARRGREMKVRELHASLGASGRQCDHSSVPRKEGPVGRRLLFVTALVISLVAGAGLTANRPAEAAFQGLNGKIAFTRELAFGANDDIFVMNPDGSDQTDLSNNPQ